MVGREAADSGGMTPLGRLIARKRAEGLTFREMERRTIKAGEFLSSSAFEQIASGARRRPLSADTVQAVAVGLDESPQLIARLDQERWGLAPTAEPDPTEDTFRYSRPEGLSDREWDDLRSRAHGYLEALIDQAARER